MIDWNFLGPASAIVIATSTGIWRVSQSSKRDAAAHAANLTHVQDELQEHRTTQLRQHDEDVETARRTEDAMAKRHDEDVEAAREMVKGVHGISSNLLEMIARQDEINGQNKATLAELIRTVREHDVSIHAHDVSIALLREVNKLRKDNGA